MLEKTLKKLNAIKKKKAQTSLEILIVMGGLIIIAVIVVTIILASSKNKVAEITTADKQNALIIDSTLFPPNINSLRCAANSSDTAIDFNISVIPSVTKDISQYCLVLNGDVTDTCVSSADTELSFSSTQLENGHFKVALVSKNSKNAISSTSVAFNCTVDTSAIGLVIPPDGDDGDGEGTISFTCPSGYTRIPRDANYPSIDENGFCVMKWEAKVDTDDDNIGNLDYNCMSDPYSTNNFNSVWDYTKCSTVPKVASSSQGMPLTNLTLTQAETFCSNLGTGYHLITNNEWMTIARNIELQNSNWSGGTPGSGLLKVGNGGNNAATNYNVADTITSRPIIVRGTTYNQYVLAIDYNGNPSSRSVYCNTSSCSGNYYASQPSKLILSTGDYIWDLSGNVMEYTDTTRSPAYLPTPPAYNSWVEINNATNNSGTADNDYKPSNPTWTANNQGIGLIAIPNSNLSGNVIFIRGGGAGHYNNGDSSLAAGIYSLYLLRLTSTPINQGLKLDQGPGIGFRCVTPVTITVTP